MRESGSSDQAEPAGNKESAEQLCLWRGLMVRRLMGFTPVLVQGAFKDFFYGKSGGGKGLAL